MVLAYGCIAGQGVLDSFAATRAEPSVLDMIPIIDGTGEIGRLQIAFLPSQSNPSRLLFYRKVNTWTLGSAFRPRDAVAPNPLPFFQRCRADRAGIPPARVRASISI